MFLRVFYNLDKFDLSFLTIILVRNFGVGKVGKYNLRGESAIYHSRFPPTVRSAQSDLQLFLRVSLMDL